MESILQWIWARNWGSAFSQVALSILGTLGTLALISALIQSSTQPFLDVFTGYFAGGEIGLSILALSGAVSISLLSEHSSLPKGVSVLVYGLFFLPLFGVAFIIGTNPGFADQGVSGRQLTYLWGVYALSHMIWFFLLLLEPRPPNEERQQKQQSQRVQDILEEARRREK